MNIIDHQNTTPESLKAEVVAAMGNEKATQEVIERIVEMIDEQFSGKTEQIEAFLESFFSLFHDENGFHAWLNAIRNVMQEKDCSLTARVGVENILLRDIDNLKNELVDLLENESSPEARYKKLPELRKKLSALIEKKTFLVRDHKDGDKYGYRRFTEQDLPNRKSFDDITIALASDWMRSISELEDICNAIDRIENEYALLQDIGSIDLEKLKKNRMKYGAKGANLLALQELMTKIKESKFLEGRSNRFDIPPFHLVEASLYDLWKKEGRDAVLSALRKIYDASVQYGSLMIRSSAVHSEDGEKTTGAGVYDTIFLKKGSTFEEFANAVEKVYRSCESEDALAYQAQNNVENESMGIVVQKAVYDEEMAKDFDYDEKHADLWHQQYGGYANTTRPYGNTLTDIHFEALGFPLIYEKMQMEEELFGGNLYGFRQHDTYLQVDMDAFDRSNTTRTAYGAVEDIMVLMYLLEQHYKFPVQVEFMIDPNKDEREKTIQIVQVRPLPKSMFTEEKIEFPKDIVPLIEMKAVGFCDDILDVLETTGDARYETADNSAEKGVVFFHESHEGSFNKGGIRRALPKEGAVVLLRRSKNGHGHVETIALEQGLVLLFETEWGWDGEKAIEQLAKIAKLEIGNTLQEDKKPRQLRIVANGTLARIYEVDPTDDK